MRLLLMLCCTLLISPSWAASVLLSAPEQSPALEAFTEALQKRRPHDQIRFVLSKELPSTAPSADTRLILFGTEALKHYLEQANTTPALVLRVSRLQADALLQRKPSNTISLLWSDPPLDRQLRLARALLPKSTRIGVLYSPASAGLLDELRRAAQSLNLEVIARQWRDNRDNKALRQVLEDSDLLFGLDDPLIYNRQTIKNLLLSSYAHQRPLFGPTVSFVRAGSLASTYSDQSNWLDTLDELLDQPTAQWPREQYPARFNVQSNRQVARALGITLPDDAELARRLAAGESRP